MTASLSNFDWIFCPADRKNLFYNYVTIIHYEERARQGIQPEYEIWVIVLKFSLFKSFLIFLSCQYNTCNVTEIVE